MEKTEKGSGIPSLLLIFAPMFFLWYSPGINSTLIVCIYSMFIIFIKSTFYNHLSTGDEIWSTAPIMYAYLLNDWSPRGKLQFVLVLLWGVRLSFNLWRKGGYRGLEDYRWLAIKKRFTNPIAWQCFRIFFICIYQVLLNLQLVLPILYNRPGDLIITDWVLFSAGLFFIAYQMVADQQQWEFQCRKTQGGKAELAVGFVNTGLWKYCRHPNYFAELGLWWSVFGFTYGVLWTAVGAAQMTFFFQRVIRLTEKMSSSKYEGFKEYQQTTSKLIPWPPSS